MIRKLLIALYKFKKKHPKFVMVTLVFIIVPVVTGSIMGYEMQSDSPVTIPTVIVNHDDSNFSMNFVEYVKQTETFSVTAYADSDEEARLMIKNGEVYAGVIIPKNFYRDMRNGKAPDILLLYDSTQLAVLSVSKTAMSEIMLTLKAGYMKNVFAGKLNVVPEQIMNEVQPVSVSYRNLFNPAKSFRYYLLPGYLCAIIQVGISMFGAERGFEYRKSRSLFLSFVQVSIWSLFASLAIILCLSVQFIFFDLPYRGSITAGVLLIVLYSYSITCTGYIVGSIVPDRMFSVQLAALLVLPTSILAGYSYPLTAMPEIMQKVAQFLPYTYLSMDIRALCLKDMGLEHIADDLKVLFIYAAVEILIIFAVKLVRGIISEIKGGGAGGAAGGELINGPIDGTEV